MTKREGKIILRWSMLTTAITAIMAVIYGIWSLVGAFWGTLIALGFALEKWIFGLLIGLGIFLCVWGISIILSLIMKIGNDPKNKLKNWLIGL